MLLFIAIFLVTYRYNLGLSWDIKIECRRRFIVPYEEARRRCVAGRSPNIVEQPVEELVNGEVLLPTHVDAPFIAQDVIFPFN